MSLVDFASLEGLRALYTNEFGHELPVVADLAVQKDGRLPTYERALEALTNPNMLLLFTEELSQTMPQALWHFLNETMPYGPTMPTRNTNPHAIDPDAWEVVVLQRVLALD